MNTLMNTEHSIFYPTILYILIPAEMSMIMKFQNIGGTAGRKYNKYYDQSGILRNNYIGDLIDTKVLEARKL